VTDLTGEEQEHVRRALRYLRACAGNWKALAKALHFEAITLRHVMRREKNVSPTMAFRLARFAGTSIDDLLAGKFPPAGACPHCGRC
jgi:hypothetical protein